MKQLKLVEFAYPSLNLNTFTVFDVSEFLRPKTVYFDWMVTGYNACTIRSERIELKG